MDRFPAPIYEDSHLLVLNKPAGLLTQPSGTNQESLEYFAKSWLKEKYQKPGNVFLEAVHRLDRPVSGIVLFAKTSKALSRLNSFVRGRQTKKIYEAWVEGTPRFESETLVDYLVHDDFSARISSQADPKAKEARLSYRILSKTEKYARLEIHLDSGRYHQIRIQLASMGCPIRGDQKYGAKESFNFYLPEGIALHSRVLVIPHPIGGAEMHFECLPPWSSTERE